MTDKTNGSGSANGAAPVIPTVSVGAAARISLALLALLAVVATAYRIQAMPEYGSPASFSLLTGAALGILFAGGRFCFFCIFRDFIENRNSSGLFSVLTALAVGGIGYAVVFGAFMPNSQSGRLPPDAHIGPVSWVLVVAGLAFGLGMALSGACISGHLYRLGEGYSRAPFALLGSLLGFGVGFYTWNRLYITAIAGASTVWLPARLGYGGALAVHLLVLGLLALLLLRYLPLQAARPERQLSLSDINQALFKQRWNPIVTGALVGLVGVGAYFRVAPLGVTAQLGSVSRTTLHGLGVLPERLNGLDTLAGCATQVVRTITDNGFLIGGLVIGSLAVSLLANRFRPSRLTPANGSTALVGGVLMGWGAMTALGCTVGVLLSGISAFALSGWVFGIAVFVGVWLGLKVGLYRG